MASKKIRTHRLDNLTCNGGKLSRRSELRRNGGIFNIPLPIVIFFGCSE